MKMRLVEWLRDFQAYIPKGRWRPNKPGIRQIIGDLPVVVEYLAWLENQAKLKTKQGGRAREIDLQWLVYELGLIREQITEKKLNRKAPFRRYIYDCLDGLGVERKTIVSAITYVYYHPDQFFPHGIR